nr:hypothetical protein [Bacteroides stercorirosoris]
MLHWPSVPRVKRVPVPVGEPAQRVNWLPGEKEVSLPSPLPPPSPLLLSEEVVAAAIVTGEVERSVSGASSQGLMVAVTLTLSGLRVMRKRLLVPAFSSWVSLRWAVKWLPSVRVMMKLTPAAAERGNTMAVPCVPEALRGTEISCGEVLLSPEAAVVEEVLPAASSAAPASASSTVM